MKQLFALLLLLGYGLTFFRVMAATITNCDEATLRSAIQNGGTIVLECDGVIAVSNAFVVTTNVVLDATGHNVILHAANSNRLFVINPGFTLDLRHLILTNGYIRGANGGGPTPSGFPGEGGAVYNNAGTLLATDSSFLNNTALGGTGGAGSGGTGRGAAIYCTNGQVFLTNCALFANLSAGGVGGTGAEGGIGEGGAICLNGGTLNLEGCRVSQNLVTGGDGGNGAGFGPPGPGVGGIGRGGAICKTFGTVFAKDCVFVGNNVTGGMGGVGGSFSPYAIGGTAQGGAFYSATGDSRFESTVLETNSALGGLGRRFGAPSGSASGYGGAIYVAGGVFSISGNRMTGNSASAPIAGSGFGGALHQAGGTVAVSNSFFSGNFAKGGPGTTGGGMTFIGGGAASGGAIFVASGVAQLSASTFSANIVTGGDAGASASTPGSGLGGGIYNASGVEMLNCTVISNFARAGAPALASRGTARGGGLYNSSGTGLLTHLTFAHNRVASPLGGNTNTGSAQGGALFSTSGAFTLQNSLIAFSVGSSNGSGPFLDGGHNISSDNSFAFSAAGSLNNSDPVIGPLADYGGPTPTVPLLAGSPALDAAGGGVCPSTDQRGIARPFGPACDIGAFESSPPYTILGRVGGYLPPTGITVTASNFSTVVDSAGNFRLHGFPPSVVIVKPSGSNAVLVASNFVATLGPDLVNVTFQSYRSNAFTFERTGGPALRSVFAAAAGETWRILNSTNLFDWNPYSTNIIAPSGVIELMLTNVPATRASYWKALNP